MRKFLLLAKFGVLFVSMGSAPVHADQAVPSGSKSASSRVQVVGRHFDFVFGKDAAYRLNFVYELHLDVNVVADPTYAKGTRNHFEITMTEIRPDVYMVKWIEPGTGNTVTHVLDYLNNVANTNITDLASKSFWRLKGEIRPVS
jgi:hypothetical protein